MPKKILDYLQDRSQNIDFVSYIFDILESDSEYSKGLTQEQREECRKLLRTRIEDQAINFPLTNFGIDVIQLAETKNKGMFTTAFSVGKGKEVSFFGAMRSKEGKIIPKKKFLSSEIVGVDVFVEGIPGLSKVETDERLQQDILRLFKTKLVDIFGIIYVKNQRLVLQTAISRNLEEIRSANLSDNDYAEIVKLLVDVFVRIGTYLRQPHLT